MIIWTRGGRRSFRTVIVVVFLGVNGFVKPLDGFQMPFVDGVEADGTSDPFEVFRGAEQVQNARETEDLVIYETIRPQRVVDHVHVRISSSWGPLAGQGR